MASVSQPDHLIGIARRRHLLGVGGRGVCVVRFVVVGLPNTALPLDRACSAHTLTHTHTRPHSTSICVCVLTLGRLLPDTKFVPTAHERLSACPGPETILQLWSGRGAWEKTNDDRHVSRKRG